MGDLMRRCLSASLLAALMMAAAPAAVVDAQLLPLPDPPADPGPEPEAQTPERKTSAPEAEPEVEAPSPARPVPPPSLVRPSPFERAAPPAEPPPRHPLLWLFLALLGIGLSLIAVERARGWVSGNVALHRSLGVLGLLLRLSGFGVILGIIGRLVPEGEDWILWALAALALVVGWSVRDLFADVIAGVVLAAERRVKKGVWVSGDGFQGTVEGRTARATWLRDGQGHRLTVPNRAMVGAPMVYDAGVEAEHEVVVRLEGYQDASKVRMALTDAILSSPWVLAGANPVVLREPADPVVWRVRTKLLEPRFSVHFEGELLERVEDLLRFQPEASEGEEHQNASEAPNPRDSSDPVE